MTPRMLLDLLLVPHLPPRTRSLFFFLLKDPNIFLIEANFDVLERDEDLPAPSPRMGCGLDDRRELEVRELVCSSIAGPIISRIYAFPAYLNICGRGQLLSPDKIR